VGEASPKLDGDDLGWIGAATTGKFITMYCCAHDLNRHHVTRTLGKSYQLLTIGGIYRSKDI
jgi:hypothetical protein